MPQRYNNWSRTVFSNNWYYKDPEIDRASLTLYSDWSDRLSTKFKYTSYEMLEDDSSYGDDLFPEMNITITDSVTGDRDNVFLGGDRYRGANLINVESEFLTLKADYNNDDHVYTIGFERDESDVVNLFIARYNAEVRFSSFEDYQNGVWSRLRIHEPYAGHEAVGTMAADFEVEKNSLYIQDKWFVNNDLTVMFGLRYDEVETPIAPATNVNFVKEYGFSNASKFDFDVLTTGTTSMGAYVIEGTSQLLAGAAGLASGVDSDFTIRGFLGNASVDPASGAMASAAATSINEKTSTIIIVFLCIWLQSNRG